MHKASSVVPSREPLNKTFAFLKEFQLELFLDVKKIQLSN